MIAFQQVLNSSDGVNWGVVFGSVVGPLVVSGATAFFMTKSQVENKLARLEAKLETLEESNNRILDVLLHRHDKS